jgi:pyruvate dehydrogenase E2 component (dihydrolipoamide acetyltransferase)
VRKLARENSVDLSRVTGTGAGGRITKQDVEAYIVAQKSAPAAPAPAPQTPAAAAYTPPATGPQPKTRVEPMSTMRIKIAEHMIMSQATSAHVTTIHRVDMTKVARMRARHKEDFQARHGIALTFLPFVVRATVEGLRTYPLLNASIDGNNIIYHNEINIGIAVALENGLIVPVIRQADEKNVLGLQRAIVDLAARARSRQLKPDEVQGGTFSISNFGSFGSVMATPVINQPQVGILGVGAVTKDPVVIDDAIAIRSTCYLSLSFDHRLIDGAVGDQFTAKVKSVLESWSEEVL